MAQTLTVGCIDKRINSTSISFAASKTVSNVLLKEPCDSEYPVFQLSYSSVVDGTVITSTSQVNYIKWGSWYYWVDRRIYLTNDILELHCHLDPLATYKTAIKGSYGLVIYGDKNHHNTYCDDTRFYPEKLNDHQSGQALMFDVTPSKEGCIVMTFTQTSTVDWMDPHSTTIAGTGLHTAIMSTSMFASCIGDLTNFDCLTGWSGDGALEIVQAFQRMMQSTGGGSLLDNIQRCIWLPFDLTTLLSAIGSANYTTRTGIMIGGVLSANTTWYETSNTFVLNKNNNLGIAINDLTNNSSAQPNPFLKNDRWMSLQITTPGGYTNIPTECLKDANYIYLRSSLCINDGSFTVKVCREKDKATPHDPTYNDTLASFSGCVGVNIKGSIYGGPSTSAKIADAGAAIVTGALAMGIGSVLGGAVASKAGGEIVGGMIEDSGMKTGARTISSGIQGNMPGSNINVTAPSGSFGGSVTSLFINPTPAALTFYAECWAPMDLDNYETYCAKYGYPCNSYLKLSSLATGSYCQCAGFSVQGAAGASEEAISKINSYVNSGIYLD